MAGDDSSHDIFPLAVAVLSDHSGVAGKHCLLSASALWHLLPSSESVGRFFAVDVRTTPRWSVWRDDLAIDPDEVRSPPKSVAAKKRARPDVVELALVPAGDEVMSSSDDDDVPTFSQYMITPKMLLGAMMWLAHMKRAADNFNMHCSASARVSSSCSLHQSHCLMASCWACR